MQELDEIDEYFWRCHGRHDNDDHHHHHGHHHHHHHNNYKLVILNLKTRTIMSQAKIQVSQNLAAIMGLVDVVTKLPVVAVFTNVSWSSDNTAVMTTEQNAENANEQDITGVAAGAANLLVSATAAYTDSNGDAQSMALTATIPVSVAPIPDGVELSVTFGAATVAQTVAAPVADAPVADAPAAPETPAA